MSSSERRLPKPPRRRQSFDQDPDAERFLESLANAPEPQDPSEHLDEAAAAIDIDDTKRHCSTSTMLTLAVIMVFFGTSLVALTNKQDFTDTDKLSLKGLLSGRYLSQVESRFNDSIPLRDYVYNISSAIKYCFGLGNEADFIDIEAKLHSDDPYSVETYDNYVPVSDSRSSDDGIQPDGTAPVYTEEEHETTIKDDGNNKKLGTITLSVTTTEKEDDDPSEASSTTTNNRAPGATTTTTVPPATTTPGTTPPPVSSDTDTETEPPDNSQPDPPVTSETDPTTSDDSSAPPDDSSEQSDE